jgi:hypothetical protein
MHKHSFTASGGEIQAWIEQETSVHLRAVTPHGDPVEMNEHELKQLIDSLQSFYQTIRESI